CGALLQLGLRPFLDKRVSFGAMLGLVSAILFLSIYAHPDFVWIAVSPSTDVPAALMAVYSVVSLALLLDLEPKTGALDSRLGWRFALCAVAAVMAVTIKMSHLPVALAVGIAAWRLRSWCPPGRWPRVVAPGAVLVLASGGLWILHGLLLSGCALFPVGASCAEWIPWSADPAAGDAVRHAITTWARAPIIGPASAVPGGLEWIPLWLEHMWPYRQFVVHLAAMAGILAGLAAIFWALSRARGDKKVSASGFPWCFGLCLAGILLCGFSAPDPRFAIGFLIGLAGCLVAKLFVAGGADLRAIPRWASVCVTTIILTVAAGYSLHKLIAPQPPEALCCAWRRLPVPEYEVVRLQSGLDVKVPTVGDQCWSLAGPCTPNVYLNDKLILTKWLGRSAFMR
ncbi:MAG: hypothetical protein GY953_24645, partial [bacterium]|nr:hypothetical protein [bacterium]